MNFCIKFQGLIIQSVMKQFKSKFLSIAKLEPSLLFYNALATFVYVQSLLQSKHSMLLLIYQVSTYVHHYNSCCACLFGALRIFHSCCERQVESCKRQ